MAAPIVPQEFMLAYDYLDWRVRQVPFASLGASSGVGDCDLTDRNPVRLRCAHADAALLPTLGIQPVLGRNFTRQEDQPKAHKVAMISYGLWRARFGEDPRIVGTQMRVDAQSVTVTGVLPPDFELPGLVRVDVLLPQALDEAEQLTRKTATLLYPVGRLKPGVTIVQARAALEPLFQESLQFVSPELRKDVKLRIRVLHDRQVQDARAASWLLMAAVMAVLLIACANVSNLLLARGAARQRELAIRAVLGARRGRLIRQTLMEILLLGGTGGAAGCALAVGLLRLFVAIAPEGIPRLDQAELDPRVLLFTLASSLAGLRRAVRSGSRAAERAGGIPGGSADRGGGQGPVPAIPGYGASLHFGDACDGRLLAVAKPLEPAQPAIRNAARQCAYGGDQPGPAFLPGWWAATGFL